MAAGQCPADDHQDDAPEYYRARQQRSCICKDEQQNGIHKGSYTGGSKQETHGRLAMTVAANPTPNHTADGPDIVIVTTLRDPSRRNVRSTSDDAWPLATPVADAPEPHCTVEDCRELYVATAVLLATVMLHPGGKVLEETVVLRTTLMSGDNSLAAVKQAFS